MDKRHLQHLSRSGRRSGPTIDCGTDLRPTILSSESGPANGITVDKVLLTHFHRDQCSSAAHWQAAGAQVVIPFVERRFLEEADLLRAGYDTFDNYTAYYPTYSPLPDVRNAAYAHDYAHIDWEDVTFEVVPLPATPSAQWAISLRWMADACWPVVICSPRQARCRTIDRLQWRYMDFQGHINLAGKSKIRGGVEIGTDSAWTWPPLCTRR